MWRRAAILFAMSLFLAPASIWAQNKTDALLKGKAIRTWLKELQDDNDEVRFEAMSEVMILQRKAGAASPLIPGLTNILLTDKRSLIRSPAAGLLGNMGKDGVQAIPALLKVLKADESWQVRSAIVRALYRLGDPSAASGLAERAANDPDESVRVDAVQALGSLPIDPKVVVPVIIQALQDRAEDVRAEAAWRLGAVAKLPEVCVPALAKMLRDESPPVRRSAAWSLGQFGPASKSVTPALLPMLRDDREETAITAAAALWKIEKHKAAIPSLAARLQGNQAGDAALELSEIGTAARSTVPEIIKLLRHQKAGMRAQAAQALAKFQHDAASCVPAIASLLKDEETYVRVGAAAALEAFGPEAKPATPLLVKALADPEHGVRIRAALSLWRIEKHKAAIPALIDCLRDPETQYTLRLAARALGEIGPGARAAIPDLAIARFAYPDSEEVLDEAIQKIQR